MWAMLRKSPCNMSVYWVRMDLWELVRTSLLRYPTCLHHKNCRGIAAENYEKMSEQLDNWCRLSSRLPFTALLRSMSSASSQPTNPQFSLIWKCTLVFTLVFYHLCETINKNIFSEHSCQNCHLCSPENIRVVKWYSRIFWIAFDNTMNRSCSVLSLYCSGP